jgi:3-oxoacyl-[acyl-carrier-protein] synthase III
MIHGTEPAFAGAMRVRTPFPPAAPDARYVFEVADAVRARECLHARWRALFAESLQAAGLDAAADLALCFVHQTHAAQLDGLEADLAITASRLPRVVADHGNMGSPAFAVALAQAFARLEPGQRYLMEAVGGGLSWCAIVAEHA